jgi:hydrogenase maturation protease
MIAVVGCGHPDCGDDAVGLLVAQEIERANLPGVRVELIGTNGLAMFEAWEGCDSCIVVDAMVSGQAPGTVMVLREADWDLLRNPPACSTHSLGPAQALRLAAAVGALPPRVDVIGVEGAHFEQGATLSPAMRSGVNRAACRVIEEISTSRKAVCSGTPRSDGPSGTRGCRTSESSPACKRPGG